MLYHFELQLLGVLLLPAMLAAGIFMWYKRRKANQELSDAENIPFWEVYNEYDEKLYKLNTEYFAVITDFADNFDNMTNEKATELMNKATKHAVDQAKLEKTYIKKMAKVISPTKTLRFYQAMNKIQAMIDAQMAAEVPLLDHIE